MNTFYVSLILCLIFSLNTKAQNEIAEIVLTTENGKIYGTLLTPDTKETVPIVLIIAGSGPTDRDGNNPMMKNNSLKMLAEGLLENGIASLRFDKRGIAQSKEAASSEAELRFETYVDDAISWAALLNKDERFNEIIILGHSEGALIGMLAAQKSPVKKYISLAGPGEPAGQILKTQLAGQPQAVLDQAIPIIEQLEKGQTVENVPPMMGSLFRPSVQPYMISWFKYNPSEEIAKLECPIFIVQGTTDIQVSVEDAEKLIAANEKSKLLVIEGMNHIFKTTESDKIRNLETYHDPEKPLHKELIPGLVEFIK